MPRTRNLLYVCVAPLALAAGCAGPDRAEPAAVNTGLEHLSTDRGVAVASGTPARPAPHPRPANDLERLAQQSAVNLQSVLDEMDRRAPVAPPPAPPAPPVPVNSGLQNAGVAAGPSPGAGGIAVEAGPVPSPERPAVAAAAEPARAEPPFVPPPPPPEKTVAQKIEEASLLLVDLLRQQAASGEDPRRAYLALAGLEALRPGASQRTISPAGIADDPLTPEDQAAVDGVRELVTTLVSAKSSEPLPTLVRELADRLSMTQPLRIGAARLCTRVLGYGRITPMATGRLMQGRPHRAIVYVELAAFAQRPATESEATAADSPTMEGRPRFAVDLSQEIRLYHDADGVLAWSLPEQRIVEASTNRRRDFYLVQQVTLPQQLSVGAYKLKIVIRDQTTGARDEAIIALQVVADPGLAQGD